MQHIQLQFDTRSLLHYRHSPNNYSHFLLGNLLELYVYLKQNNLLDKDVEVRSNNPTDQFESLYGIFRADQPGALSDEKEIHRVALATDRSWSAGRARALGEYIREFAAFVRTRLDIEAGPPDTLTYVRRPARLLGRFIVNENAVVRRLQITADEHGLAFQAVYLEKLNFRQQVQLMAQTKLLIGPHGAGLVNSLFCQPASTVIEISLHPDFVYSGFPAICALRDITYARIHAVKWWLPTLLSLVRLPMAYQSVMKRRIRRDRMVFADVESLITQLEQHV